MSQQIVEFIRQRFFAVHGAMAPVNYGRFMSRMRAADHGAALGYRLASEGRLFLESYLDEPVERVLRQRAGMDVTRERVVEIGGLAANSSAALVGLWNSAVCELGDETDIGVAVLIRPLRAMFRRLGITVHELAPARAERLGAQGAQWGSYYQNDPVVCAGSLIEARRQFAGFLARRRSARVA
jgi:Thermostable hemolysin